MHERMADAVVLVMKQALVPRDARLAQLEADNAVLKADNAILKADVAELKDQLLELAASRAAAAVQDESLP
jgi:cell division protein FtsB